MDLHQMTARQLSRVYARGEASPVEAAEAVLARIAAVDPEINAFCLTDTGAAREAARASERRHREGAPLGPLDGVPVSVKDLLLTRGWPTLRGSCSVPAAQEWPEDAPAVARLREAGAVPVGKTTTPEFGWKGVTDGPLTGVTRNPWDTGRTSGGSSGGSAAAVAAGAGPLSVGTDGGGSVRIPAAFCGVFGMKPTYGRIPLYPASPFGTLSHAGPLTRTADDAALLLDAVARPDVRDWSALPPPEGSYAAALEGGAAGLRGLRVAFSPSFGGAVDVHPEVAARVREAVSLMERLGARVEHADPPLADPVEAFHTLWFAGAAKVVEHLPQEAYELLDPGLREVCAVGAGVTASEYLDAVDVRMALGAAMGRFHETYDLLVTPAVPLPAFEAGVEFPSGGKYGRWTGWTPFSYPFNLTQQPAASVPCGLAEGLPAGVQLVAARHADALVLRAAHAVQEGGLGAAPLAPLAPGTSPAA